jgi:[ribosomal protein S5]-alanine N-acetyltransferase
MDPIETPRLILRAFRPGDAADLFAYLHQPRATCFLENRLPDLAAAERAVVELSGDEQQVAITLKESGR